MKKTITLLSVLIFSLGNTAVSKAQTATSYNILSTAYDRSSSNFFPLGAIDNNWFLTEIQDLVVPLNPTTVITYSNDPTYVVTNSGNNFFTGMIGDHSIN